MLITRCSLLTGRIHEREIDVTEEQLAAWKGGRMIQDVMPLLSAEDREYLISGATPQEWAEHFGSEEE
jgi:hypothetical protein